MPFNLQQARHMAAIRAIAEEIGQPVEEVASLYQEELARLSARAAIADYLPVLVSKRLRQRYRGGPG